QAFGRTAADDAGFEAAFIAKEIGRPVRLQWMRDEETAWDTKGPAFVCTLRGALDAAGNLVAYDYKARSADYNHVGYNEPDTVLTGRGIAYAFRNQTVVAQIAEVEVDRKTGRVWVKRLVCAHDCGLIVNPDALRRTVECAMLHSVSRALHEEVQFDTEKVTSL